ncbi:MAG: ADOP family duplicated permease [Bryobacteraceae bacterium]
MNWTRFFNRLKGRPAAHEEDLDAELAFHQNMKERDLLARGMTEGEARRSARRGMGNLTLAREEAYEAWTIRWLSDSIRDLRHAARTLTAQPGFTLATVLALVLGIAVNAILFNVYNALALAPWAIRDAKQTVQVFSERRAGQWIGFSWPHFRHLQANTQSLAGLAAFSGTGTLVSQGDASWGANAVAASENYFELIGTGFAAGRGFSGGTGNLHDPAPEIVLHYDTWMTRFGGDRGIVGAWLELSGRRLQVVGVAAAGFSGPTTNIPHMWIPGAWRDIFNPAQKILENPNSCCVSVIGRLKPGVSRAGAQAELNTLSTQFVASAKREKSRVLVTAPTFLANPSRFRPASAIFLAMGAASLLILLLACANVANLQLARATARRREIAVRLSLGASRGRILRQLVAEGLLLSGIAGAASVAISAWAPGGIVRMIAGPGESLTFRFANDVRVLAFILFATFVAAMLFGLAPALTAVRDGTAMGLREGGRATSTGRMRSILLAAQVALCAILLSGTALLVRALDRVRHLDTGFQYEKVIVMSPGLDASGVSDERARGLLVPLIERIGGLPGVESVARASVIPYGEGFGVRVADRRTEAGVNAGFNEVSANFFETLRIPLLHGRSFTRGDEARMDTVIINEAAAQRLWPGESPLGKTLQILPTLRIERKDLMRPLEVIGVVRNFGGRGFGTEREPYICMASPGARRSRLLIRHSGEAGPLMMELPKHAREIDRRFLASAAPYSETIANALRSANLSAAIASVLGTLSLLLACVGIYGVAAYNVSQRTREVGVRMALGARPRAILAMVLKQNLRTVVVGAAVGIVGAISFGRLLTSLLYGVKPTDPLAMLVTIAILFGTSALATWGPARRASRVDPAITLRHE